MKTFVFAGTGAATRVLSSASGIACINTFLCKTLRKKKVLALRSVFRLCVDRLVFYMFFLNGLCTLLVISRQQFKQTMS